jgi:hypothetical protein
MEIIFHFLSSILQSRFLKTKFSDFPAAVDPEPVGGIAAHGGFECAVHIAHDVFARTRPAVFVRRNFLTEFEPPFCQRDTVANGGIKLAAVTQSKNGGRQAGIAIMAEERRAQAAGILVGEQPEDDSPAVHGGAKLPSPGTPLKKVAAAAPPYVLHQPVERRVLEGAVSRGELMAGTYALITDKKLKVPEVADG